ncbi:MAG TPA: LCP family protein [Streptosporangiaceae bacterium]|nr:LCP family protein [Streptosporangiaceae bacterium]
MLMTDWPEDWFRDAAGGAGGAGANQGGGAEPPTVRGAAGPGDATSPGGRQQSADQLTQPVSARSPYSPGQPASPGGAGNAGAGWPAQPAAYTAGRPPRARLGGPGLPGWRRFLRPRPIALALAAIISLAIIGTVITYFYLDSQLTKKNVLVDYPGRPAQGQGTNWLITGSDSRQGLTNKQIRRFSTGFGIGGQRSDTIMVVHVPAGGHRPVLISIPRDSWVAIPGYGHAKINAAFAYGGPKLLAETVQNVTGLRIDHYMGIGFGGFVRVVDAIGGVRICLKTPLVDPNSGLHLSKGCHNLTGGHALGFVRSRHTFATQDLQRVQNQRLFLRALLRKLTSTGVILNPFKALPAASNAAGSLIVDNGTSLYQLVQVALALKHPITTTAPIATSTVIAGQDAILLDTTKLAELDKALNDGTAIPKGIITGSKLSG